MVAGQPQHPIRHDVVYGSGHPAFIDHPIFGEQKLLVVRNNSQIVIRSSAYTLPYSWYSSFYTLLLDLQPNVLIALFGWHALCLSSIT